MRKFTGAWYMDIVNTSPKWDYTNEATHNQQIQQQQQQQQ